MEPDTTPPAARSTARFVFLNPRGLRAGWRLTIFIAIAIGIPRLLVWLLMHFVASAARPTPASQPALTAPWLQLMGELLVFLWVLLCTWIMSRIEGRRMGEYGLPIARPLISRFFAGYVFWGFLPLSVLLLVLRLFGAFSFGDLALHGASIFVWAGVWLLVFLSVGLFEEYSFRGYMLITLADGIGFWPAAILLSVLFGFVHSGNPGETRIGLVAAGFFALFASGTLRRTGSLWLAVGAHAGWDWGQSFFYGVSDSGVQVQGHLLNPAIHGPVWLSGGATGPEGSVLALIIWGLMIVAFLLFYRDKRRSELLTGPAQQS